MRPRLIYASISGYGQDGPYRDRAGFGNVAEAMGGIRYVTGFPDRPPVRAGFSLADELAAQFCVIGVLAALHARERDGIGDRIDATLLESCVSVLEGALPEYGALGQECASARGTATSRVAPSNIYPTKDGKWLAIGGNADGVFRRLMAAIGRPELGRRSALRRQRGPRGKRGVARRGVVRLDLPDADADDATRFLADARRARPVPSTRSRTSRATSTWRRAASSSISPDDERRARADGGARARFSESSRRARSMQPRAIGADTAAVLARVRADREVP